MSKIDHPNILAGVEHLGTFKHADVRTQRWVDGLIAVRDQAQIQGMGEGTHRGKGTIQHELYDESFPVTEAVSIPVTKELNERYTSMFDTPSSSYAEDAKASLSGKRGRQHD